MIRNRYPGVCCICGKVVQALDGWAERGHGGVWRVKHVSCAEHARVEHLKDEIRKAGEAA